MKIYCCECGKNSTVTLITGEVVYPHRKDLADLPYWQCVVCKNYVGCHHKTKDRTRPLGCIANPEIKEWRKKIHMYLDVIWKRGGWKRRSVYKHISKRLGREFHASEIRTVAEAQKVLEIIKAIPTRVMEEELERVING